jgi:hypothetical protein
VPQDANQPLPRYALFLAQRPAHVGQNDQSVRHTFFPELALPYQPPRARTVGGKATNASPVTRKAIGQPDFLRRSPKKTNRSLLQKSFAGGIHESKHTMGIEGKQRSIDFFDHAPQQRVASIARIR